METSLPVRPSSSTADATSEIPVRLRDVVVVGGGCYGTFYARQLERAARRGAARYRRVLVVDRNPACQAARELGAGPTRELVTREWGEFFDDYLSRADLPPHGDPPDAIVPSPLMPHLMYEWLLRRTRAQWPDRAVAPAPLDERVGTPYETVAPDGTRYVSFAAWLCPVHCIEPAVCPVIRAPRTWELTDALERVVVRRRLRRPTAGPVLFLCRHRVFGVGMFDARSVLDGAEVVNAAAAAGDPVDVVVGTVSACHGAVAMVRIGPRPSA